MIDHGQTELLGHIAARFKALSDVSRLRLVLVLREGAKSVGDLVRVLEMPQAGVSKHLGVLKGAGLVESSRQKNQIFYRVSDERIFDLCAVVCDGVFKQIKGQQALLAAMPGAPRKAARQGASK